MAMSGAGASSGGSASGTGTAASRSTSTAVTPVSRSFAFYNDREITLMADYLGTVYAGKPQ